MMYSPDLSTPQIVLSSAQESLLGQGFIPLTLAELRAGLSPEKRAMLRAVLNVKAFGQRLMEVC